jgi:Asp-tRNA(Asn)/Glu-tRNA(Gln) amidotransferase A subunit family amidase
MNLQPQLSAVEILDRLRAGAVSGDDVARSTYERIGELNDILKAFTASTEESKIESVGDGQLAGVPVAIKELIAVKGMPHTGQSLTRQGLIADRDADVVSKLCSSGAFISGTTRTHELAWGITTQHEQLGGAVNPWNMAFTPGGSSGGSAVAVASGMVPVALGTDTACSVRIPAVFCGVVGFRPTAGWMSTEGILPLNPSIDTVGIIARDVADIELVFNVLANHTSGAAGALSRGRVGIACIYDDDAIGNAQRISFEKATQHFSSTSELVDWPHDPGVAQMFGIRQSKEALDVHRNKLNTWPAEADRYGADVRARLQASEAVTDEQITEARCRCDAYADKWNNALENVDAVVLPASGSGPSKNIDPDNVMIDGQTMPLRDAVMPWQLGSSLLGLPTCAVPVGLDDDGVPIGVQIVGRKHEDSLVLQLASDLYLATRPNLPPVPTMTAP